MINDELKTTLIDTCKTIAASTEKNSKSLKDYNTPTAIANQIIHINNNITILAGMLKTILENDK